MTAQHSTLESPSGANLEIVNWPVAGTAKAIVQINHGMCEHAGRYDRFANQLNLAGYTVFAHDHRGHGGTTAPDAPQGLFGEKNGWNKVLTDVDAVVDNAKQQHPDVPVVLFGHSMGAIIGVNYCIRHSDRIAGAALWNSGVDGGALLAVYKFLLAIERMFKGSDVPSTVAKKLTFETWNRRFDPNRTDFDWLSRDAAEVDKYETDPLCGFDAFNGLWRDLAGGIATASKDQELKKLRNDLPIHLLAGGQDPCSEKGKAVERLEARLRKAGVHDVTLELHPDNRHEALNELNRDTIMKNFIAWLERILVR